MKNTELLLEEIMPFQGNVNGDGDPAKCETSFLSSSTKSTNKYDR